jgi:methionyl-tRNA formyltransferase
MYLRQTFISYCKQSTNENSLESLLDKHNVPLFVVRNTEEEDVIDLVKSLNPDLGVIYVHRILNKELFSIPKLFTINLHPGILPKYAGGEPSFWSLVDRSNEVGLTVYKVTEIADKGKIILIKKIPIGNDHSCKSLNRKVKKHAPQALVESILKIKNESDPFILNSNGKRLYRKPASFFTKLKYRKFL